MKRTERWLMEKLAWARHWSLRMRFGLIGAVTLAVLVAALLLPPIVQVQKYHGFADQRACFGLPNCVNVLSNLPFFIFGGMGLCYLASAVSSRAFAAPAERLPYAAFFLGAVLIGLGSSYYHLAPDDGRLVFDRLPMTISLMAIFSAALIERISVKAGLYLLAPLLLLGAGSVIYWRWSEINGMENLNPYGAVQFYPILSIPLMLLLFPARYSRGADILGAIALYAAAKLAETLDHPLFALGHIVSGHTLKHVVAALAFYWVLRMLYRRRLVEAAEPDRETSEPALNARG